MKGKPALRAAALIVTLSSITGLTVAQTPIYTVDEDSTYMINDDLDLSTVLPGLPDVVEVDGVISTSHIAAPAQIPLNRLHGGKGPCDVNFDSGCDSYDRLRPGQSLDRDSNFHRLGRVAGRPSSKHGCDSSICDCSKWIKRAPLPLLRGGGWVQGGITYNSLRPANPAGPGGLGIGNLPVGFNYRSDNFQLNQVYAYLENPAETGGCGCDVGFRADFLYGEDYYFVEALGLERHQDGSEKWNGDRNGNGLRNLTNTGNTTQTGTALPQAYGEIAYNNVKLRAGHFYTTIGYESVMARDNFFYSHAYTMQFGEPFTHTGALAMVGDDDVGFSIHGGIHTGWDVWWREGIGANHYGFLGGLKYTTYNQAFTLAATVTTGDEPDATAAGFSTRTLYSVVAQAQLLQSVRAIVQHDWGIQINGVAPGQNAEWYGLNSYLLLDLTQKTSAGIRYEWFNDQNGFRIAGAGSNYYEITAGLNCRPNPFFVIRPEVRWDWQDFHTTAGPVPVFDINDPTGPNSSQFTAAVDVIFKY